MPKALRLLFCHVLDGFEGVARMASKAFPVTLSSPFPPASHLHRPCVCIGGASLARARVSGAPPLFPLKHGLLATPSSVPFSLGSFSDTLTPSRR